MGAGTAADPERVGAEIDPEGGAGGDYNQVRISSHLVASLYNACASSE